MHRQLALLEAGCAQAVIAGNTFGRVAERDEDPCHTPAHVSGGLPLQILDRPLQASSGMIPVIESGAGMGLELAGMPQCELSRQGKHPN